jgi:hypothetical protein
MDLSRWNLEHYIVPFWTRFKLNLGAQPFRCETCRCNFASFRPRRERFSWRKHRERGLAGTPARLLNASRLPDNPPPPAAKPAAAAIAPSKQGEPRQVSASVVSK